MALSDPVEWRKHGIPRWLNKCDENGKWSEPILQYWDDERQYWEDVETVVHEHDRSRETQIRDHEE